MLSRCITPCLVDKAHAAHWFTHREFLLYLGKEELWWKKFYATTLRHYEASGSIWSHCKIYQVTTYVGVNLSKSLPQILIFKQITFFFNRVVDVMNLYRKLQCKGLSLSGLFNPFSHQVNNECTFSRVDYVCPNQSKKQEETQNRLKKSCLCNFEYKAHCTNGSLLDINQ